MGKNNLTVIIITRNEEKEIEACMQTVKFADKVLVIDSESTDGTVNIAKKLGAIVISHPFKDFATQREVGLKHATSNWVLYIDADERVSEKLAQEIKSVLSSEEFDSYIVPRKNFFYKKYEWPGEEQMLRLFRKSELLGWFGKVHESPRTKTNKVGHLKNSLFHYTHKDLASMVEKTNNWSEIEADLLLVSNHPSMKEWRFVRVMLTKFTDSFFKQGAWKMGTVGVIESVYQAYSYFIVYAKLWERQKNRKNIN